MVGAEGGDAVGEEALDERRDDGLLVYGDAVGGDAVVDVEEVGQLAFVFGFPSCVEVGGEEGVEGVGPVVAVEDGGVVYEDADDEDVVAFS